MPEERVFARVVHGGFVQNEDQIRKNNAG